MAPLERALVTSYTPSWKTGQLVLLLDKKIKPRSDVVISHVPYKGPYVISQIISGDPEIGVSYKLVEVETGKTYPYAITSDRLKSYHGDRIDLQNRLPALPQNTVMSQDELSGLDSSDDNDAAIINDAARTDMEPAIKQ